MFSNHFVMSVVSGGKIQEELANGVVKMPFDSEYSLKFRNKHDRRAVVHILIDGEDVSGGGYIIPANDFVEIKRHHAKDRAFKFVSLLSEDAQDFGKNGPNDDKVKGTIEARFYLEKEQPKTTVVHHDHHHYHDHPWPRPWPYNPYPNTPWRYNLARQRTNTSLKGAVSPPADGTANYSCNNIKPMSMADYQAKCEVAGRNIAASCTDFDGPQSNSAPEIKDGCTVEGDTTGQNFTTRWIDLEETYTTLKVFMQGYEPQVGHVPAGRKPKRRTYKEDKIDDLEGENERLRRKLAELENEKLKQQIEDLEKSK